MNDPIVDEVRRIRDAHAARFGYDLDEIYRDIKEREQQSGLVFIDGVAHQVVPQVTENALPVVAPMRQHTAPASAVV